MLLCFFYPSIYAGEIDVSVTCQPQRITVGDSFILEINIDSYEVIKIKFDDLDAQLDIFKKRDFSSSEKQIGDIFRYSFKYDLTTYETGNKKIGPIVIKYLKGNQEDSVTVQEMSLFVDPVLDLTASNMGLKAIPDPEKMKFNWITILIVMSVLILLLTGIMITIKKMRKQNQVNHITDKRTASEMALYDLQRLKYSGLIDEGSYKQFYVELSNILRLFLGRQYNFLAIDRTSKEILNYLKKNEDDISIRSQVDDLLSSYDLTKFAKYNPKREEAENIIIETEKTVKEIDKLWRDQVEVIK